MKVCNHLAPFTTLKFRSPTLNCLECAFKKVISYNDDSISSFLLVVMMALSCYQPCSVGCNHTDHLHTRPPVASGCVFQFITSAETWVYSFVNLWLYWSAEKAKSSSLPKIGCSVCRVKYCQRKWEAVSERKGASPHHLHFEDKARHWGNISAIIAFDILFYYLAVTQYECKHCKTSYLSIVIISYCIWIRYLIDRRLQSMQQKSQTYRVLIVSPIIIRII